ncbi:YfiR family protein [Nisaea sp.]|uniref:YfiR family protein n=1 Tax=Nisaea sp. TaxID=2024842 RepID=UPI0032EB5616
MLPHRTFLDVRTASRFFCAFLVVLLGVSATAVATTKDSVQIDAVKAAFVFNFAKFTMWPEHRLQDAEAAIVFCLHREDLDHRAAKDLERQKIDKRSVTVRILETESDIRGCHLLFLSLSLSRAETGTLVEQSKQENVLLISDMPGFAERGGHIALVTEKNRFRFKINLESTIDCGLKLSSKLLQLADIVTTSEP